VPEPIRVPFKVERNYAGWRLDRYLAEKIRRLTPDKIEFLIANRLETTDGSRPTGETLLVPGFTFHLLRFPEPEPDAPLHFGVVHHDDALLVVDKPSGLPIHPTARYYAHTFTAVAKSRFPELKVDPAHRLDRETSGLLACGTAPEWTTRMKKDFFHGNVKKVYLALALGTPPSERFEIDAPLALTGESAVRVRMHVHATGAAACTAFEVLERRTTTDGAPVALLACFPRTGRQHQIRAHLHHAGLHLVGDKIYGPDELIFDRFTKRELTDDDRARLRLPRHALHAWKLELPHPKTRETVTLEAPLAEELKAFWDGCADAGCTSAPEPTSFVEWP
jgi:23S rRNA pseudouridine1911/1915/1917 synthase